MSFDGWVSLPGLGADFRVFALNQSGHVMEEVFTEDAGILGSVHVPWLELDPDVYGLRFSDSGLMDVGICNLVVWPATPHGDHVVPAPGAAALVMVGLTLTGLIKRRVA